MIKAKRLMPGDTIGVISPASRSESISEIIRAQETWEAWGYKVIFSRNLNKKNGFVAGAAKERAEDLNEMFARDDVDAVFVTQGGYGSAQILSLIDFETIQKNPKILTGFSDITSLHLAIQKHAGLVTFHSPGFSRFNPEDMTDYTKEYFFKAIAEAKPMGEVRKQDEKKWVHRIRGGVAEGVLTGGNMSLVCATLGTPYEIDTAEKILLLEEVDSEPWLVDHLLSHLTNAGKLRAVAGVMVGECENCGPSKLNPGYYVDTSLEEVLHQYLEPLGVPVLYGLPLGHGEDLASLPLGVTARIDGDEKKFYIVEAAVR